MNLLRKSRFILTVIERFQIWDEGQQMHLKYQYTEDGSPMKF